MIQRLRRRFIATNMFLVSLVLLIVFSGQLFDSYRRSCEQIERAQRLALEAIMHERTPSYIFGGDTLKAPDPDFDGGKRDIHLFPGVATFSVKVDQEGNVLALQSGPSIEVTDDLVSSAVAAAMEFDGEKGGIPKLHLRYLRESNGQFTFLSFADDRLIGSNLRTQLISSLILCGGALLAFFLISRLLAKVSLQPVERAWQQQRQFVADASHELKTPLSVILANTALVLSHPEDTVAQQGKWIGYIQEEAQGMRVLVEDLLFLAKSDAARSAQQKTRLDLSQLISGSILPFESVAFERSVTLTDSIQPGLSLLGDEAQLRRLVGILLDNAIKYAGPNGQVCASLSEENNKLRFTVHNTGPAIPPEHLPHLFERFYRADAARGREDGSYGLGLSIAKSIVTSHDGKISVTSTQDQGTTFTVLFFKNKS